MNKKSSDKIVLTGQIQVGKSTLLRRLLEETDLPVSGFMTELDRSRLGTGIFPLYVYPAAQPRSERVQSDENLIGLIGENNRPAGNIYKFNTIAAGMLKDIPEGNIIVMDELGNLEEKADIFKTAVFCAFESDNPVLAVVKQRSGSAFLGRIMDLQDIDIYVVTEENREDLFAELKNRVRKW